VNQEDFTKLKFILEKQFDFDETNSKQVLMSLTKAYQHYLTILSNEMSELVELKGKKEVLRGERFNYYKRGGSKFRCDNKDEYLAYINAEPEMGALNVKIAQQDIIVKFLDNTLANIKSTGYNIKTLNDIQKFLNGD